MNARLRGTLIFAALAAGGATLVSALERGLHERITDAAQQGLRAELAELVPGGFDNDPLAEIAVIRDSALGPGATRVYPAQRHGAPAALIYEITAPDGYNGDIALRVGVDATGRITGLRVLAHRETAGLTAALGPGPGAWTDQFLRRSLADAAVWALRSEGGAIDQISGATVSSRAVVAALHRVLHYHAARTASQEALR